MLRLILGCQLGWQADKSARKEAQGRKVDEGPRECMFSRGAAGGGEDLLLRPLLGMHPHMTTVDIIDGMLT